MSTPSAPRRRPSPYGAAVERDDRLLTALAEECGEQPLGGDPVAGLLGAWRREILRAGDRALRRPAEPEPDRAAAGPTRRLGTARSRAGRWRRTGLVVAAAAVAACAALGLGALHARPADPLWRLTQAVYPQRATAQLIEETLGEARTALAEGRLRDARARLAHAAALLDRLATGPQTRRLWAELEGIRRAIDVPQPAGDGPATTGPHAGPTPGTGPEGTDAKGTVDNGTAGGRTDAPPAPPAGTGRAGRPGRPAGPRGRGAGAGPGVAHNPHARDGARPGRPRLRPTARRDQGGGMSRRAWAG